MPAPTPPTPTPLSPALPADWSLLPSGDEATFNRLWREYWPYVLKRAYSILGRDDAENAAAEVFLVAWRRCSTYRPGTHPLPWLAGITVRECLRQRQRTRDLLRLLALPLRWLRSEGQEAAAEPEPEQAPMVERLRTALSRLPARRREAVTLRFLFGVSVPEIAEVMGIRENSVTHAILQGLAALPGVFDELRPGGARGDGATLVPSEGPSQGAEGEET